MKKSILYRLFRLGKTPKQAQEIIQKEQILLSDEGCKISITYKKFKTPGKYFSWKRNYAMGSIIITEKRVLAYAFSKRIMNFPFAAEGLTILKEKPNVLFFQLDVSRLIQQYSGIIEIRFFTDLASDMFQKITTN